MKSLISTALNRVGVIMLEGKRVNFKKIWNSLLETNKLTIKHLQNRRKLTENKIEMSVRCGNKALICSYKKTWTELNEEPQDIWGIDRDHEMHRFWEIPGCTCPAQDNMERYGWGKGMVKASHCPIHGEEQLKWEKLNEEWTEECVLDSSK